MQLDKAVVTISTLDEIDRAGRVTTQCNRNHDKSRHNSIVSTTNNPQGWKFSYGHRIRGFYRTRADPGSSSCVVPHQLCLCRESRPESLSYLLPRMLNRRCGPVLQSLNLNMFVFRALEAKTVPDSASRRVFAQTCARDQSPKAW